MQRSGQVSRWHKVYIMETGEKLCADCKLSKFKGRYPGKMRHVKDLGGKVKCQGCGFVIELKSLGRPKSKGKSQKLLITRQFMMDQDDYAEAKAIATKHDKSTSYFMRKALGFYLNHLKTKKTNNAE